MVDDNYMEVDDHVDTRKWKGHFLVRATRSLDQYIIVTSVNSQGTHLTPTGHKRPVEEETEMEAEDGEEDGGGGSPLYSNWDLRGMQHLLPLQDYIMQQAKLSSEYLKQIKESCNANFVVE